MLDIPLTKKTNELNAIVLAYVGDAIYEVYIRRYLVAKGGKPNTLHKKAVTYVSANAQSEILEQIMAQLTEDERDVVKRGRNAKSKTMPKNVSMVAYRHATAFEALLGYLHLNEKKDRLEELIEMAIQIVEKKQEQVNNK